MAFYAGKAGNNIATIDNFATSLDDLRLDVQHLEQELAKKTGIRPKNRHHPKTDQAFVKAEALLKQGDLANAGLYFSNGISQAPGNWDKINRYQQSVLDYCRQRIDNSDYEMALNVLGDMNTFMRTQALYVPVQDIEKLQQALTDIAQFKQSIVDKMTQASQMETAQFVKTLLSQTDELLAQNPSADNPALHVETLKENIFALQSLDANILKPNDSSKIAHQITQLENTIATLEQQLATAQAANTISTLAQRATQFIDNAKNEPAQSDLVLYYLTSAESIIRQLVLVAPNMEMAKTQIATLSEQLEQAKQEIAKRQSETVLHEIVQASEQIKIDKRTQAQKAIEQLSQFRQLLAEKSSQLSSVEALEKAQAWMEEVNNQIANWQAKQTRKYEQWAIMKITTFYNRYQDELGAGFTDEDRVYSGIIRFLGNIDIRYLSTPAQTAYNEAFQKFYAELRDDQKIPLSSKMTLMDKKPLSNF
ncbi:hypothetical protein PN36_06645 [Candidatus Thiomargarita nelsonii]|uniref:Uncharacterized protein n=1 Tax=Candidatus Thiomargarita nelsonii TaxID=1003181 RepID=A0A0A6S4K1_9GAMM|nr:hypothetical protein PN36_06645 [Candidatus Thiomargarita nelsonii]